MHTVLIITDNVREILSLYGCSNDLHVWGMSAIETALTAHIVMSEKICDDAMLAKTANELHNKFGIEHTTLQVEIGDPNSHIRERRT
ncbi:MAG: hypothetical protein ABIU09_10695 [Pyrinomonadaceae bacterium]